MGLVEVRNVSKSYRDSAVPVQVLDSFDMSVEQGEMLAVVGPSGVGKSTLLHLLGGLDRAESGTIQIGGREIVSMPPNELSRWRNGEVGFVFQFHHLLPEFTAAENVAMPLWIGRTPRQEALDIANRLLEELGLDKRRAHFPSQLSGGEQQRVAIARALASDPSLLLADEPTGNLDHDTSERVFQIMRQCHVNRRLTSIIVTHNRELAERCDRILDMGTREGR